MKAQKEEEKQESARKEKENQEEPAAWDQREKVSTS
jgi:hypothetical protein